MASKKKVANALAQSEEKYKQNLVSNGRFHSDWLSMMYSRLKLASIPCSMEIPVKVNTSFQGLVSI